MLRTTAYLDGLRMILGEQLELACQDVAYLLNTQKQ